MDMGRATAPERTDGKRQHVARMNLRYTDVERKTDGASLRRILAVIAAAAIGAAAVWDALRGLGIGTRPVVSYALVAFGIAAGCGAVFLRVFARLPERGRNTLELVVLGLVLLGWRLRGHPEIPADPPIVAVQILAAIVLAAAALFRRRTP
jgi:hypothetical protein